MVCVREKVKVTQNTQIYVSFKKALVMGFVKPKSTKQTIIITFIYIPLLQKPQNKHIRLN